MTKVLLCAEREALVHPELLGLEDERIDELPWLIAVHTAQEARDAVASEGDLAEAWIVSCEDMDILNLAAAVKADRPSLSVVATDACPSGSMLSRAQAAHIDQIMTPLELVRRFGLHKIRNLPLQTAADDPCDQPDAETMQSAKPDTAPTGRSGFLMTVVSGSGGVGKSTFSALAAYLCAQCGMRTLLIDCDLQFGDTEMLLDAKATLNFEEAVSSPESIRRLPDAAQGQPCLIRPPAQSERAEEYAESVGELVETALTCFDVVIANTGSFWNEAQAMLVERSARTIFMIDQTMSSLRGCRRALGLCARCGIATGSFLYVLNRCSKSSLITAIDLSCALEGVQVEEIEDGGRTVEEYMNASMIELLVRERNECSVSIGALLARILPAENETMAKVAGVSLRKEKGRSISFIRHRQRRRDVRATAQDHETGSRRLPRRRRGIDEPEGCETVDVGSCCDEGFSR